ncbi:MAG: P-loop NTPase [bacterium]
MNITIASGKGGTGKTFISTNLAYVMAEMNHEIAYLDCDVEEPDGHLFLQLDNKNSETVNLKSPAEVDAQKCTGCGLCVKACSYNAINVMKDKAMIFPELCHVCGGCSIVCPQDAIIEKERKIGDLIHGNSGKLKLHYALLHRGEGGMSPRLIKRVKEYADSEYNILDSPPGTACSAVETVMGSDLVILVADPTPFGVNDLKLSVEMCRALGLEPVLIINRAEYRDDNLKKYVEEAELDIIGEIPDDRKIAEIYSEGKLVAAEISEYRTIFENLVEKIKKLLSQDRKTKKAETTIFTDNKSLKKTVDNRPDVEKDLKELVVISGKGGTGKTSITAGLATLFADKVISDCDVDAADLHLLLQPEIEESGYFSGGSSAEIIQDNCVQCGECQKACRFDAIKVKTEKTGKQFYIDDYACEGCGVCGLVCEYNAIKLTDAINGEWYISKTRFGPMAHARLGIAEENSGRLVTLTRKNAAVAGAENNLDLGIIDGSPGTGCPVIASLTGSDYALIVTEPTVSGIHDLERILEVTEYFQVDSGVIVNKSDINSEMTQKIKDKIHNRNKVSFLGEIPYDDKITEAQMHQQSIIEFDPDSKASEKIKDIYRKIRNILR